MRLGLHCAQGRGAEKDLEVAKEWLTKAAEKNHAAAQAHLADLLAAEDNADDAEATRWYRAAAEAGHAAAQNNLGRCLAEGIGVEADTNEAMEWYRRAAEQDCLPAQFNLGRNLLEAHSPEAARWLELAATADHTEAQWLLGRALDDGITLPRDAAAAVKWLRKAAEGGVHEAQYRLAVSLERGDGVMKNLKEAADWLKRSLPDMDISYGNHTEYKTPAIAGQLMLLGAPCRHGNQNAVVQCGYLLHTSYYFQDHRKCMTCPLLHILVGFANTLLIGT